MGTMLAAALLLAAGPQATDDCRDDRLTDRCTPEAKARQHALYGVEPIERAAQRRVPTVRAFFVDGYGRDAGVVTLTRPRRAAPRIAWRAPPREGQLPYAPLSAAVPVATWNRLLGEGAQFDRPPAPPGASDDICLHSWVIRVEAVDADGRVRRRTQDTCNPGGTWQYAYALAKAAVAALPACALLDPAQTRNEVTRLGECAMLSGDTAAAALAFNAARTKGFRHNVRANAAPLVDLFAPDALIAWRGESPVRGAADAARAWGERIAGGDLYIHRIIGEDADRVRIEGGYAPREARTETPILLRWQRADGRFRVTEITVP